jgi:hypothetical protein
MFPSASARQGDHPWKGSMAVEFAHSRKQRAKTAGVEDAMSSLVRGLQL